MYRSSRASLAPAAAALLGAILILSLSACARKEQGAASPPTASGLEMRVRPQGEGPSPAGPRERPSAAKPKPAALKPLPPPLIASPRAFGLAAPPGPLLPSDYSLGPLQDLAPSGSTVEEAAILEPAQAFLAGLLAGRLEEASLLPDRRPILASLLAPLLAGPRPLAYRLGKLRREGEAALAPLRLEAAAAADIGPLRRAPRAEGELRLRREEGLWYVEDLALDPAGLRAEPPAPAAAFEPGFAAP